jgi:hypothetical protein
MPNGRLFERLKRYCGDRDQRAKRDTPDQGKSFCGQAAGASGVIRGIDSIRHAKSFRKKELCARSKKIDNINSE